MIAEKVIPGSNFETIKKRIKFLEAIDHDDVTFKLLKLQISLKISEEDKAQILNSFNPISAAF